jgi:hypothetical protein
MNSRLLFSLGLAISFSPLAPAEATLWENSHRAIEQIRELEEEKADLPQKKWLGRDQAAADRDIENLLDDVLAVFEINRMTELRKSYGDLDRRIAQRRTEIRELREAMISAPEDASPLEFYKKTREKLQQEKEACEQDITAMQQEQEQLALELQQVFREQGIVLNAEQVRFYLGTVSGEDIMTLGAVFENVRSFNGQLEELMQHQPGDTEAARRYYGMHVVLIRTLLQAHNQTLKQMDEGYLKRLDALEKENQALQQETARMLRFASTEEKPLLQASLRTQNTTQEAIELYRDHLVRLRDDIYEAQKKIQRRYDVAVNAFRTIRISALLMREMESALQDLDTLRSMQLPDLIPIQDAAIREKFLDIGTQLRTP